MSSEKPTGGVSKLKEILFEDEQKSLKNIIGRVTELNERTQDISTKTNVLYERTGTDNNLRRSIAGVLDGAITDAESRNHRGLSSAMAPVVVKTIRQEITNQREGMVQALYPITGRLVQTYVANAYRDFMAETNQKLEGAFSLRHWGYRFKSLFTGIPYRDLVLHNIRGITLKEIYLIKRGSGELVDFWDTKTDTSGKLPTLDGHEKELAAKKTMISGFLTAIMDFSREAFSSNSSQLRSLDMGRDRIYLRASPAYLVAARCQGQAKPFMERALDDEFLRAMELYNNALSSPRADNDQDEQLQRDLRLVLPAVANGLQEQIQSREQANRKSAPLAAILLFLILSALFGWIGWQTYLYWKRTSLYNTVQQLIDQDQIMRNYPTEISVTPDASSVTIFGLAPDFSARDRLADNIKTTLGENAVRDEVAVLPGLKTQEELRRQLAEVSKQVGQVETNIEIRNAKKNVQENAERANTTLSELQRMKSDPEMKGADDRLSALIASIQKIQSGFAEMQQKLASAPSKEDLASFGSSIAKLNARLDQTESATEKLPLQVAVKSLTAKVTKLAEAPPPPKPEPPKPGVRDWIQSNAIFFADGTRLANESLAGDRLDELAALMKSDNVRLRIVGYTDGQGSRQRNQRLGEERAERIASLLIQRNIEPDRLITIGRRDALSIAPVSGSQSPNRRVEFEIAFRDEVQPQSESDR